MKIKSNLYCITDKNNKPDYRFLFENPKDAQKRIKLIKNSTRGETLFLSKVKRDFFVDGVRKDQISTEKKVIIKKGCWTGLKVARLNLLDTVCPEAFFKKTIRSAENQFSFSKQNQQEVSFQNPVLRMPVIPNPFLSFDWDTTFLKTRTFVSAFSFMFLLTIGSVFLINQSASKEISGQLMAANQQAMEKTIAIQSKVLGSKDEKIASTFDDEMNKFVLSTLKNFDNLRQEEFEGELRRLVGGTPMEKMIPYIAQQDRTVAAFIVGIAKKESDFGRHVPVLNGQDCFNYWGYRGIRSRMGSGGHTCFDSPEDAVNTVAGRISELVQADINTPQEMVLWKCGSACDKDPQGQAAVKKWINDVSIYFYKLKDGNNDSDDNA